MIALIALSLQWQVTQFSRPVVWDHSCWIFHGHRPGLHVCLTLCYTMGTPHVTWSLGRNGHGHNCELEPPHTGRHSRLGYTRLNGGRLAASDLPVNVLGPRTVPFAASGSAGHVRSGLLLGRLGSLGLWVRDHESHEAASATVTSEVTSLESSYARIFRDDTAEPTTNVAKDHSDVPQANDSYGFTERPVLQLRRAGLGAFSQAVETVTAPGQIKLAKAIKGTR